jgi:hypothetical protein
MQIHQIHRRAISRRYRGPRPARRLARIAVDPPIGVTDAPVRQVTTLALQPGAVLCMFDDEPTGNSAR